MQHITAITTADAQPT